MEQTSSNRQIEDVVSLSVEIGSPECDISYTQSAYAQTILSYPNVIWNLPVSLPDFEGNLYLWSEVADVPYVNLEAFFCDPHTQVNISFFVVLNPNQTDTLMDNPDRVLELYPNYWHIMDSMRFAN